MIDLMVSGAAMNTDGIRLYRYELRRNELYQNCGCKYGFLSVPIEDADAWKLLSDEEVPKFIKDSLVKAAEKGLAVVLEHRNDAHDGIERSGLVFCVPEHDQHGMVTSILGIFDPRAKIKGESAQLAQLQRENESLVREIHHCVRNNLQMIEALLRLQQEYLPSKDLVAYHNGYINRMHTLAIVQGLVHDENNYSRINMRSFLETYLNYIQRKYPNIADRVSFVNNCDSIIIDLSIAMPCALIINELIENALKHAFPDEKSGTVLIKMKEYEGYYLLKIHDDGIGMRRMITRRGFGNVILGLLAEQLGAVMHYGEEKGTSCIITFKNSDCK